MRLPEPSRCDFGAAMPADVEEGAQPPVAGAHDENRHAGEIVGAPVAGLAEPAAQAEEQGMAAEQKLALALGLIRGRRRLRSD